MRYLIALLSLLTIVPTTHAQACDEIETRLEFGMVALVTPGEPNNVRAQPTTGTASVGLLPGESPFVVLDGPICADGFNWFHVENELLGVEGYTVEGSDDEFWTVPATLEEIAQHLSVDFTPVAGDVAVEIMPPEQENPSMGREPSPRYIRVTLNDPIFEKRFGSEILIFPLDAYQDVNPNRTEWMMQNADLFLDHSRVVDSEYATERGGLYGTRVSNNWMSGVRYIRTLAPPGGSFTAYEFMYEFSGITYDQRY